MKLQQLIEELQKQLEEDPSLGELELVYTSDQEIGDRSVLDAVDLEKGKLFASGRFEWERPKHPPTHLLIQLM